MKTGPKKKPKSERHVKTSISLHPSLMLHAKRRRRAWGTLSGYVTALIERDCRKPLDAPAA